MDLIGEYDSDASSECDGVNKAAVNGPTSRQDDDTEGDQIQVISTSECSPTLFVRNVPHRRGCWWSHVYIPFQMTQASSLLIDATLQDGCLLLQRYGFQGPIVRHSQFHISLSRHFSLQQGSIEQFVSALRKRLQHECRGQVSLVPQIEFLVNDEGTRSFIVWKVMFGFDYLKQLVYHVDHVLNNYKVAPYYDPPCFHISIASFPGNAGVIDASKYNAKRSAVANDVNVPVSQILCCFGNEKLRTIDLN